MSSPASFRLCSRAPRIDGSWRIDWFGSPQYQRVENPCQTLRERPSLNENRIAITTGAIAQTMYAHVTTPRKRGWPHGFAHQSRKRLMRRPPCATRAP